MQPEGNPSVVADRESHVCATPPDVLDRLLSVGAPLLVDAGAGARAYACFAEARSILTSTTSAELLEGIITSEPRRQELALLTSHLDHIGLVLPEELDGELAWAASRAGFPDAHARISSVVVARELGALLETDSVPTTFFKAYGRCQESRIVSIEAFVPHGVPRAVVHGWVADGVGVHVALKTKTLSGLYAARKLFETEGYSLPAFMCGKAITNPDEESTILYFDRACRSRRLRVECSWSPEPLW
jgi:hypothetical protein